MKQKNNFTVSLSKMILLVFLFFFASHAEGQILGWNATNVSGFGPSPWAAQTVNPNVTASGLFRGSSIGVGGSGASGAWGGSQGWNSNGATADNSSFYFTVQAKTGYKISLSNVTSATRRSAAGPSGYTLYYSVDGGAFIEAGSTNTTSTSGTTGTANTISLSGITALQNVPEGKVIKFRINPTGSTTGTYYLTGGSNALRLNGTVEVSSVDCSQTPLPQASSQVFCTSATVADLTATGQNLKWYATQTGTAVLSTAAALTTGTYYVSQTVDTCESNRTAVNVTINATAAPTASDQLFCTSATVADLIATGQNLKWYASQSGTAVLADTALLSNGTYYVSQTVDTCESSRTAVTVTIHTTAVPTASAQTMCSTATVADLQATGQNLKWYANATDTVALNQDVLLTENTYYVSQTVNGCESERQSVNVTLQTVALPLASDQNLCGSSVIADLQVTGDNIKWYASATGTDILQSETALSDGTYYVSQTINGCESARRAVVVTLNTVAIPVADDQTFCGASTRADLTASGDNLKWYASPTSTVVLTPETVLSNATYYVSQTINGCESARKAVQVVINSQVLPQVQNQSFCGLATVADLVATGQNIQWYATETGTDVLTSDTQLISGTYYVSQTINGCEGQRKAVLITITNATAPVVASQTLCNRAKVADLASETMTLKWYATENSSQVLAADTILSTGTYYVSQLVNACESARTAVQITINTPAIPTANTSQVFCGSAVLSDLVASGQGLQWYATQTATSALPANTSLTTAVYYVSQTIDSCESDRLAVNVIVNTTIAPTASATQTFCDSARITDLMATGQNIKWYATASDINALPGTTVLSNGTYYVSQTINNCESPRTSVEVIINTTAMPIAEAQAFCIAATVADLQVTGQNIQWYASSSAAQPMTSATALTTATYYVTQKINDCESPRKPVQVTLHTTAVPQADAQTFCGFTTVADLEAIGQNIKWYSGQNTVQPLTPDTTLTTGTYYVSQTLNNCESVRKPVSVTVIITAEPIAIDQTFCTSATVADLQATGQNIQWYASSTATQPMASNTALITATYYVSQKIDNCESTRKSVSVTVHLTAMPDALQQSFCGSARVSDLVATGQNLKWYATQTSTTPLTPDTVLTTAVYYVSQTLNNCESERRAIDVTVHLIELPTAENQTFCGAAVVTDLQAEGENIKWYSGLTDSQALSSGSVLTSGTYYATQTINGCESNRASVVITINTIALPEAVSQAFCGAAAVSDLIATGENIQWYASQTSTSPLTMNATLSNGFYYVSQTINGCESARKSVAVTVHTIPVALAAQHLIFCSPQTFAQVNTGAAPNAIVRWYDGPASAQAISINEPVTNGMYYVSQTINGCESERALIQITLQPSLTKPNATTQTICGAGTISDLTASGGAQGATYIWYNSLTSETPLSSETALINDVYYVAQTLNGCFSERRAVLVRVVDISAPNVTPFTICGGGTISDLHIVAATGITYNWYAAAAGTQILSQTTPLTTGTYYVSRVQYGCESARTAVQVTIGSVPSAPTGPAEQSFSIHQNTDARISHLITNEQNVIWYISHNDALSGNNPLSPDKPLVNGQTYYGVIIGTNGCPSAPLAVRVDVTLGTDEFDKGSLSYYPNPVNDMLYMTYKDVIDHVQIYTLDGKKVKEQRFSDSTAKIDMTALASGIYMIQIHSNTTTQLIKVIKK